MLNKDIAKYILAFKATPKNEDAIYYYKPGLVDMVVINPRFKDDDGLVERLISYLHSDVEQKKRFSRGTMELRESCLVSDVDDGEEGEWREPGQRGVIPGDPLGGLGLELFLPGGELELVGQSLSRSELARKKKIR